MLSVSLLSKANSPRVPPIPLPSLIARHQQHSRTTWIKDKENPKISRVSRIETKFFQILDSRTFYVIHPWTPKRRAVLSQ
jgi:hypothetical protein